MAILDFPQSPTQGQTYAPDTGIVYVYNGYAWEVDVQGSNVGPQGPPGEPADMARVDALEARCAALEAAMATKATLNGDVRFNTVTTAGDVIGFG